MYLSILILPLLGSTISGFMGRKIGVTGSHIITCSCLIISSLLATIAFYEVGICGSPVSINLLSWIDSELMYISWEFLFDQLTVSMFIPVLYISSLIHIFSTDYMSEDPHNQRFFSYLSLFTFFMLLLVSGANYFVMFVGWEGIGIVSYLLINFWYTRIQANKAAILALTMNRVGDMGLSIGFFASFALFGSLDYATIFNLTPFMNETVITIIALLLLTGAMAKSAQIPLHSWLPGSMEGSSLYNLIFFNKLLILIILICLVYYLIYLLIRNNLFIYYLENSNYYNYSLEFYLMSSLPISNKRDSKGRFISINKPLIPLPSNLMEAIIGELLGDGHLRFTKKDKKGKPKLNNNAMYAMSLKHFDHAFYLWSNIFSSICTSTPPKP